MRDPRFLCTTPESAEFVGRPENGERVMWRGRAGVAEYAFDQPASLPRWTLPQSTQVLITDRRAVYAYTPELGDRVTGEVRWLWPQYLRVQPGARSADRGAAASQIQLVCADADGGFPALVLAGGDLGTVGDADRLANAIRLAISRFRVDHAGRLGLADTQTRMLSRLLIGPEFANYPGGEGQTVSLAGAEFVPAPPPASAAPHVSAVAPVPNRPLLPGPMPVAGAAPVEIRSNGVPVAMETADQVVPDPSPRVVRPGIDDDAERARRAVRAEEEHQQSRPDLASRASDLAARVASLVARSAEDEPSADEPLPDETYENNETGGTDADDEPTADQTERAERLRRSAARFSANSARGRAAAPSWDSEGTRPANTNR